MKSCQERNGNCQVLKQVEGIGLKEENGAPSSLVTQGRAIILQAWELQVMGSSILRASIFFLKAGSLKVNNI